MNEEWTWKLNNRTTQSEKKILKGILYVMSSLVVMYLVYFIYKLSTGAWNMNDTLGIGTLGMLLVVIAVTTIQYNKAAKILQNQKEAKSASFGALASK